MEDEIKRACWRAGAKLGIGLSLVAAVLGVRVITTAPAGVEGEVAKLERVEAELANERAESGQPVGKADDTPSQPTAAAVRSEGSAEDDSIVSRFSAGVRKTVGGSSDRDGDLDAERLVSCRLPTGTQFMRAADCGLRGGQSTDL